MSGIGPGRAVRATSSGFQNPLRAPRILLALGALVSVGLLVVAPPAGAEATVVSFDCGYDAATNTFLPVATVSRTSAASDLRVAVQFALFDGATQIATLGSGKLGSGVNGTVLVPVGVDVQFRPEAGVAFGDGSAEGGGTLLREHAYRMRSRLTDFDDGSATIRFFDCSTEAPLPDTDGDGYSDELEEAYATDGTDPDSRPVVPDVPGGWIAEPLGPAPDVDCGPIVSGVVDSCELRSGDIVLQRNSSGLSKVVQVLGNTYYTHSAIVIGRLDLDPGDGEDRLSVAVADITPDPALEGRTELALLDINIYFEEPDAVAVYRPLGRTRIQREKAARDALMGLWNLGAGSAANRTERIWNAPLAVYKDDAGAFGPTEFYCTTFIIYHYPGFVSPDPEVAWWKPADWFITPDELIEGYPGMALVGGGYNTDAGWVAIFSPAHILVTDPLGRRTGVDSAGNQHSEIPGAHWLRNGTVEAVSAPGLASDWSVTVTGFDSGEYALVYKRLGQGITPAVAVPGFTRAGLVETYELAGLAALTGRPVAVDDELTADAGVATAIDVLANDSDIDGDPLEVTSATPSAAHGTVACSTGGTCAYRSTPGYAGPDSFTYSISDGTGGSSSAVVHVTVLPGNDPPSCSSVTASPTRLWPPNHHYITVTLSGATDPDGEPITYELAGVTQDEPINGLGDGDIAPDAKRTNSGPDQIQLRAERGGTGDGRVYRVTYRVSDSQGASCMGQVNIEVRHSSGKPAVDSGVGFNSFG